MSELSRLLERGWMTGSRDMVAFEDHWHTGDAYVRDVAHFQRWLLLMGVKHGDRVLLACPNSYVFVVIYGALLQYGATVIPINPAMPVPEMERLIERAQVQVAIAETAMAQAVHGSPVAADVPLMVELTALDKLAWRVLRGNRDAADLDVPVATEASEVVLPVQEERPTDDTIGVLLFTSGTTGTPKGVALSHRQLLATARQVVSTHALSDSDVTYCFLPLFHINAQVVALLSTWLSQGRILIEPKFSASRFWATVARHGVTWVSAVPTVIGILIKADDAPVNTSTLRFVRSASAPLPYHHAVAFETRFGIPVIESYGMTEAASQICVNPVPPGRRKLGSVGLPSGVELAVVGDHAERLAIGEIGEIVLRGDRVIQSYAYGDETNASFRDHWFYTGDLGYLDEDGYLFITGRVKEIINRAGQKISPREVEEVIGRHPAVQHAAVIGLPDELYGERVTAYVVVHDETDTRNDALVKELKTLCLASVSAYKCPADFHVVEEIPVGITGKIQRHRLRQQVLAAQS